MVLGLVNVDAAPERVAGAHEGTELQFVVE